MGGQVGRCPESARSKAILARSRPGLSLERHVVRGVRSETEQNSGATTHLKVEQRYRQHAVAQVSSFDPKELDESGREDAIGSEGEKEDDDVACELPAWYLEAYGRWVARKGVVDSTPLLGIVKRESSKVPPVDIGQTAECTAVRAARRTLPYFMLRGCPEVGA
jgi:hypothetical protein